MIKDGKREGMAIHSQIIYREKVIVNDVPIEDINVVEVASNGKKTVDIILPYIVYMSA